MSFRLNPQAQPRIEQIDGSVPMLVIDDFYAEPDALREAALQGQFADTAAGYPGRHERLDPATNSGVRDMLNYVWELVQDATGLGFDFRELITDFSILTTPRAKVLKAQSHPHIDGVALAGLVYLANPSMGGTCFYRNLRLNSAVVVDSNRAQWEAISRDTQKGFAETDGYVSDSFDMWQLIHKTEGRYNQLVMYPGNIFHSVNVIVDPDPSKPQLARLTQRIFVGEIQRAAA